MHTKFYFVLIILVLAAGFVLFYLFFGQSSLPRQQKVKQEIERYQAEIDSLQKVIEVHKLEIERLKGDSLYKEEILRTRYGMSKKDEKVFQMVK